MSTVQRLAHVGQLPGEPDGSEPLFIQHKLRHAAAHGLLVAGVLLPAAAGAQANVPALDAEPRVHLGPLGLTPRFALRDLGVDTNVFNDATPSRDVTVAFVPGVDASIRVGLMVLRSRTAVEWTYYQRHREERSFNLTHETRLDVDGHRLAPYVGGGWQQTRQRQNLEIDERVLQKTANIFGGLRWHGGSRVTVDIEAAQRDVDYGDHEHGSAELAQLLNREARQVALALRVALTPLTTAVVRAAATRDRFVFTPLRDTDSTSLVAGFELAPLALISGSGVVGIKEFAALDPRVPDFTGLVAAVDTSYTLREMMRFSVGVDRDLDYSLEIDQPYYVSTRLNMGVTQAVGEAWDVRGRAGGGRLDYRHVIGEAAVGPDTRRRDRVRTYGLGVGRRLGTQARIGVDVDYVRRTSPLAVREYDGYRAGGSVTYGY
jgi:hypothetical protein